MHFYTVTVNMLRLLFLVLISVVYADIETAVRIRISSGVIEGKYVYSKAINKSYFSFRGIPYAEAPLGKLRFLPPVRPKPWEGVLETKEDGPRCTQRTGGNEDCLHLNVFTPTVPCSEDSGELLPVMVYFFGGMWIIGSDTKVTYTPDFLINKNVILVTCNYRLNIFGYLNAMQETAPGNVGLKDQVAVLEWVQENIEKFGGNPKQITIFGHSSGSECIQYHLQSPLSRGLFHRAIMQSGSSLNNMALERNPIEVLHILGQVLNMNTENLTQFVENLRQIPYRDLFLAADDSRLLNKRQSIDRARFTPSIEYTRKNAFIPESSWATLEKRIIRSIPVMIGQTSNEAGFFQDPNFRSYFILINNLTQYLVDPTLLLPKSLNINLNDTATVNLVLDEIHHKFFNNKSVPWNVSFSNYETDEEYIRGIIKTVEFLRRDNPIYYYVFGYKYIGERTFYPGVAHVGELRYLWNAPEFNNGENETDDQRVVREKMTTLWTNFARNGDPTPYKDGKLDNVKWPTLPKYITDGNPYIYIGGKLEIRENPWNHYEFWERIFNIYARRPLLLY